MIEDLLKGKWGLWGMFLLFLEILIVVGIIIVAFFSIPTSIVLFAFDILFIILAKFFYDTIYNGCKKETEEIFSEVNNAVELIKQREPWDINASEFSEGLKGVVDNIKDLYDWLEKREADRNDVLTMVNAVASNMEIEKLFEELMPKLIGWLNSNWGAFYLANNATGKLELRAALGFSKNIYNEFDLSIGEGLIGAAALKKEITVIRNVPEGTVFVTKTFLGRISPKNIMLVPIINNEQLIGVLCLASIYDYTGEQMDTINTIKYYLGIALGNCIIYERTKRLTNELQFQNSLIQSLNEELENKVSDRTLFLKNIMDSIRDYAIYVLDKDGIILEWNKGAEIIYGYCEDEAKGKHVNFLYSDNEAGNVSFRINSVISNGYYTENGWRNKKDGSKYYAELTIFGLYNDQNEFIGMTSVTKDITELIVARNEAWFQKDFTKKLVEVSRNALVIVNDELVIEFFNKIAQDLLNMEHLMGISIASLFEDEEEFKMSIGKNLEGKSEGRLRLMGLNDYVRFRVHSVKDELSSKQSFVIYLYHDNDRRMT